MHELVQSVLTENLSHEEMVKALQTQVFAMEPWRWGYMRDNEIDELPVDSVVYIIREFIEAMTKRGAA